MTEPEDAAARARRHYQRGLFDAVAPLYEASRPGYPPALAEFVAATAGLRPGDPVLEVGCGTGQLTRALVPFGFALTAIDPGRSLTELARQQVTDPSVTFRTTSFEALPAAPESFALVIAGAAFHWVDPEIRFAKAAELLRPGGWLAVAGYDEVYDAPLGPALTRLWQERADPPGAWATRPADADAIRASGLFEAPLERGFRERLARSPHDVMSGESTRATFLSWPAEAQREFRARLRQLAEGQGEVGLTLESSVTLARVRAGREAGAG